MKESKSAAFNIILLSAAFFVFAFFAVLLTLNAVILHRLSDSHAGSSRPTPDSNSAQRQIDVIRATMDVGKFGRSFQDERSEDSPREFPNDREENKRDDQLDIRARQRRDSEIVSVKSVFESTPYFRGGTLYTRWGRVNCSDTPSTTTVYSGVIGVSNVGQVGGGSNHLCLPFEPEYGYQQKGLQYTVGVGGSLLQGVEYRADNIYPFKNDNNGDASVNKEDAVCSVCHVSSRSVTLMIPAKRSCPKEWTLEYAGYLMAAHFKNHRTDFLCVDESPEGKPSGENTNGGSYLYPVEGGCGALPCPNYREGLEIACAVCTK